MPNFLYEEPINSFAARLAARHLGGIVPAETFERLVRVVAAELRGDDRNASPARVEDITETLPSWAQTALARGVQLHLFSPCPVAVARMKRTLKSLRDAWLDLRAHDESDEALALYARKLFQNLDHLTFGDLEAKSKAQSRMRARVSRRRAEGAIRTLALYEAETLEVSGGKRWRRICSVEELGETGKRMRNCTAPHRPQSRHYNNELVDGTAEFWVLEAAGGEPLIELMASTTERCVLECQGGGNRPVDPNGPELAALMRAKGFSFRRATGRLETPSQNVLDMRAAAARRELNAQLFRTG